MHRGSPIDAGTQHDKREPLNCVSTFVGSIAVNASMMQRRSHLSTLQSCVNREANHAASVILDDKCLTGLPAARGVSAVQQDTRLHVPLDGYMMQNLSGPGSDGLPNVRPPKSIKDADGRRCRCSLGAVWCWTATGWLAMISSISGRVLGRNGDGVCASFGCLAGLHHHLV